MSMTYLLLAQNFRYNFGKFMRNNYKNLKMLKNNISKK